MKSLKIAKSNSGYEIKRYSKNIYISFTVYLLSIVSMILAVVIKFTPEERGIYEYIYIIPFLYGTCNLIFIQIYKRVSLFKYLYLGLLFIRYFINPLLLYVEGFPDNLYYLSFSYQTIVKQAFVMNYEMFIMFFIVWIIERKITIDKLSHKKIEYDFYDNKNFGKLNFLVCIIVIFTIGLFCAYPDLLKNYRFIFDSNPQTTIYLNREIIQTSVPSGLRWLGYTLGETVRYVIVQRILLHIFRQSKNNPRNVHIAASLFIVFVNSLVATSRNMVGIIMSLIFFTQIVKIYPKSKRLLKKLMLLSFVLVIIFIGYYFKLTMSYKSFANILESYTGSTYEVYQSLRAFEMVDYKLFERLYTLIIGDTLGFINIISTFISKLGIINSTAIYNSYLYGNGPIGGHIVPMVSQASFYFGMIFSPLFSVISILLMYKMEKRINKARSNYIVDMFLGIVFSVAPIMYNYSIILVLLSTVALPVYIMSILNRFIIGKSSLLIRAN